MHLWDQTIPQAEISLNLLRGSRINPKLSAYEQLHGRFDFNATPLAPPGVKVLAHARAGERATWATHAFEAWYVGPALEHYRCFTVWATKTRKPRIVNQVLWFPPKAFPKLTSEDLLRATIEDLKVILLNPPTETYVGNLEQTQRGELLQLQELLHQTAQPVQLKKQTAPLLGVPTAAQPKQSPPSIVGTHAPLLGVPNTHTKEASTEDSTPRRSNRSSQQPSRYVPTMANQANAIDQPNRCAASSYPDRSASTDSTHSTNDNWYLPTAYDATQFLQEPLLTQRLEERLTREATATTMPFPSPVSPQATRQR